MAVGERNCCLPLRMSLGHLHDYTVTWRDMAHSNMQTDAAAVEMLNCSQEKMSCLGTLRKLLRGIACVHSL